MFSPQKNLYKKYARDRINSVIFDGRADLHIPSDCIDSWNSYRDENKNRDVGVVLSRQYGSSYHLFNLFYDRIKGGCRQIRFVCEASDNFVEKEIRGFDVCNYHDLHDTDKNTPLLIIALEDYEIIRKKLNEYGFEKTYCFYALVCRGRGWLHNKALHFVKQNAISQYVMESMFRNYKEQVNGDWNQFRNDQKGKKLFLFASGNVCVEFYSRYKDKYKIEGIIDNATSKKSSRFYQFEINTPEYLENYNPNETVVLITAINYEGIYKQLIKMGYKHCYVYTLMEAKRPKYRLEYNKRKKLLNKEEFWNRIYGIVPINKNKITIIRHYGKGYGCHSKYIVDKLHEQGLNYEIVWLVNNIYEKMPTYVNKVENTAKNRAWHLATSRLWLDNDMKLLGTRKRTGQKYINTWHGTGISLKKFYLDDIHTKNLTVEKMTYLNRDMADVYLAGSTFIADIYKTAFAYDKRIEIIGSPRVDILINDNKDLYESIRRKLRLKEHQNLLLYAPTMRTDEFGGISEQKNLFHMNFTSLKKILSEKWGGEWVAALRLHPQMPTISEEVLKRYDLIDLTTYQDVQELLLVTDILITDYSSIMFDMGYACKRVILYTEDESEYINQKELLIDIDKLPFPKGKNQNEIESIILDFDDNSYREKVKQFNVGFGIKEDGMASERTVSLIQEVMS